MEENREIISGENKAESEIRKRNRGKERQNGGSKKRIKDDKRREEGKSEETR